MGFGLPVTFFNSAREVIFRPYVFVCLFVCNISKIVSGFSDESFRYDYLRANKESI